MQIRPFVAGAVSTVLVVPAALAALTGPAAAATRATVVSDQPAYTRTAPSLPVDPGKQVDFRVDLPMRDLPAARAYLEAVSTPSSAQYGAYLSPTQFRDSYGPTQASVDSVTAYLTGQGLTVTSVRPSRTTLSVRGSAAAVTQAFGAGLRSYNTPASGDLVAVDRALTAPAPVASLISGVRGLSQAQHLITPATSKDADVPGTTQSPTRQDPSAVPGAPQRTTAPPSPGFKNTDLCAGYYRGRFAFGTPRVDGKIQPYTPCGYVPNQIRAAYGIDGAVAGSKPADGAGTTIAITDAYNSPTAAADLATYSARHGVPALKPGQYTSLPPANPYIYGYDDAVNGDQCGEQGWYGEQTLDIEAVHGVAPGANILYVPAASCDNPDFNDALATIVDGHLADAISNSWGDTGETEDAATIEADSQVFLQAALEGIGVYFSSGDSGDNTFGDKTVAPTVDLPASNPLVTAVGGTSLGIGKNREYLGEDAWGTGKSTLKNGVWDPAPPGGYVYGGGGGASSLFTQPFYQKGVVPNRFALKAGVGVKTRTLPDISMLGDPNTGMLVGQTQTFLDGVRYDEYRIGGTSLSSPLMAGLVAVADQAAGFHHGFINPAAYKLNLTGYVHDIKDPTVHYAVRADYGSTDGISDPSKPLTTSLRSSNQLNTLKIGRGWDDATGVGTPNGVGFLTHLGSARR